MLKLTPRLRTKLFFSCFQHIRQCSAASASVFSLFHFSWNNLGSNSLFHPLFWRQKVTCEENLGTTLSLHVYPAPGILESESTDNPSVTKKCRSDLKLCAYSELWACILSMKLISHLSNYKTFFLMFSHHPTFVFLLDALFWGAAGRW